MAQAAAGEATTTTTATTTFGATAVVAWGHFVEGSKHRYAYQCIS